jgi:transposase
MRRGEGTTLITYNLFIKSLSLLPLHLRLITSEEPMIARPITNRSRPVRPIEMKAVKLRLSGLSMEKIAITCGVSKAALYKWFAKPKVKQLWDQLSSVSVEEAKEEVRARSNALFAELQRIALQGKTERNRIEAIKVLLRSLGAEQPREVKVPDAQTSASFTEALAGLLDDEDPEELIEEVPVEVSLD